MKIELCLWKNIRNGSTAFESLARFREGSGFQVFAIEHGLGENEIEEMLSLLRQSLRSRPSLSSHWLLWVIYATELGYSYEGDEYWPSLRGRPPSGDRETAMNSSNCSPNFRKCMMV